MEYTIHGILQARILEWVTFPFSRGSSQPRDWNQVSCIAGRFFTIWATREAWLETAEKFEFCADLMSCSLNQRGCSDPFLTSLWFKKNIWQSVYTNRLNIIKCQSNRKDWMLRVVGKGESPVCPSLESVEESCKGWVLSICTGEGVWGAQPYWKECTVGRLDCSINEDLWHSQDE